MHNFIFHNPTKIIFGRGTVPAIGTETAAFGSRALLVYGQNSSKKNGIHNQVTTALTEAGVSIVEHGGVCSNPLLSHVRAGIAKVREHELQVIVAVGGGSVIDTAKAIAAGSPADCDVWDFFIGKSAIKAALSVTTVLTLAAAGSEMNGGMVITNDVTKEKFAASGTLLYPKTSVLAPELTFTVPPTYTAYGAADAIAHVLEFYMTTEDDDVPVQMEFMEGLIRNAMQSCERCLADPCDYGGRAALMWTATLALNGLTGAGLGRTSFPMHMIEHSLSALYNVPHGAGLAAVVPAWLRWRLPQDAVRIAGLGQRVFGLAEPDAEETVRRLRNWLSKVGCPVTLAELNIPEADIPRIAANALNLARIWRLDSYSQADIEAVLSFCR
jgi:alcohol dehydrogenase YqhD (iron-dependent ADH family)